MAVEDVLALPERSPVADRAVPLELLGLHGVAVPGGEQRDLGGVPAVVEQRLDLVVGDPDRVLAARGHEPHGQTVAAAGLHAGRRERSERLVDLLGVAQVVVEHQRDELHRRSPEALEEALPLVGEDKDAALLLVLERTQHRRPPGVGEVLRLVDHERVEAPAGRQLGGLLGHQRRQPVLPELAVVAGAHLDPPRAAELLVGAHERGPVLPLPGLASRA